MSEMSSEQHISWRRHMVFDSMNAHSQADDPALTYVMQFNADERQCQQGRSRIQHLLPAQQRFVKQAIDTLLAQQDR
jgi:hypothetical protein